MNRKPVGLTAPYREKGYKENKKWVGLTDEEVEMIVENKRANPSEQVRYVEAKLKEKNT